MNKYSEEANLLLDSLNVLMSVKDRLVGNEKALVLGQAQIILDYFEARQKEMPIGRSVTLGYYFVEEK